MTARSDGSRPIIGGLVGKVKSALTRTWRRCKHIVDMTIVCIDILGKIFCRESQIERTALLSLGTVVSGLD
jgi:hypothetical protein